MLLVTKETKIALEKDNARRHAEKMAKDKIEAIAGHIHEKYKVDEFWIMIVGKRDIFSNKINVSIDIFDKESKPDFPLAGGQMWHIVWSRGLKELEWIIPLKAKSNNTRIDSYTNGSLLVLDSLQRANRYFGGRPIVEGVKL